MHKNHTGKGKDRRVTKSKSEMDLEIIISEVSQTEKDKYYKISLICEI